MGRCSTGPDAGTRWIKLSQKCRRAQLSQEIPDYRSLEPRLLKSFWFFQGETWELPPWGWFMASAWPGGQSFNDGRERKGLCDNLLSHSAARERSAGCASRLPGARISIGWWNEEIIASRGRICFLTAVSKAARQIQGTFRCCHQQSRHWRLRRLQAESCRGWDSDHGVT